MPVKKIIILSLLVLVLFSTLTLLGIYYFTYKNRVDNKSTEAGSEVGSSVSELSDAGNHKVEFDRVEDKILYVRKDDVAYYITLGDNVVLMCSREDIRLENDADMGDIKKVEKITPDQLKSRLYQHQPIFVIFSSMQQGVIFNSIIHSRGSCT